MPDLHPIACGCRACRGPIHSGYRPGTRPPSERVAAFVAMSAVAVAIAAFAAFLV